MADRKRLSWQSRCPPAVGSCADTGVLLGRFDGQSRLLLRALMSGLSGAQTALAVFHRQQRADPEYTLVNFILTLCREEVSPESEALSLAVKPLVCLFPPLFKQNLLTFLCLLHSAAIPGPTVGLLLQCLRQDISPTPWVRALGRQLERKLELSHKDPLCSEQCSQKLKTLSQRLGASCETGGWADCFDSQAEEYESHASRHLSEPGSQRKRRASFDRADADSEETAQESKRMKMDTRVDEPVAAEEENVRMDTEGGSERTAGAPADRAHDDLPEHIRGSVLHIKELLESQTEWDQSSTDVFQVLNECDPSQVEMLCETLNFPTLPEHTLPKLCNSILSLSPDLSYSAAASLVRSILLTKVSSLSEPASRCLVTAVTSLCSRYPRPMCHAVIEPVLVDGNIGPAQTELLNRLIESCLDFHYRLLVLQMTFRIAWNEAVLSVIHSLLDSKLVLNEEVFAQFTEQLVSQGPPFTKSVKFAKMMLTVLTKYSSHVTAAQKHSLTCCLNLNETFLKKPLQAALKRIPDT
ncbi:LOW QUALITY PROTEIN: Fanconi anemia group E protein [Fundulus heteroclitus]|uniref:LOW QUALITY PROTEIN: Fanconi anemia group E protein n=1 Tax=Fundulus heteroclitus TaxID=8078 RepID=UPI00165A6486|nr:LOW QUALITY PROTEIN: Fanconi anemia group E protein [Fundulus heteroclitus]